MRFDSKYLRLIVSRLKYCPVNSRYCSAIRDQPRFPSFHKRKTVAKSTEILGLPTNISRLTLKRKIWRTFFNKFHATSILYC